MRCIFFPEIQNECLCTGAYYHRGHDDVYFLNLTVVLQVLKIYFYNGNQSVYREITAPCHALSKCLHI